MFDFYKVNAYKITDDYRLGYLDKIIVKKGMGSIFNITHEVLTNTPIDIVPEKDILDSQGNIKDYYVNYDSIKEYGYQLIVYKEDFTQKNKVSINDIDSYCENFEENNLKKIYDAFILPKKIVKQKIKEAKKSKGL